MINYRYFDLQEFKCNCCSEVDMDDDFVRLLDELRHKCGIPFVVNSGYRCEDRNKEVGGVSDSSHLKGIAVDIRTLNPFQRNLVVSNALSFGINRIGIGSFFVHLDVDEDKIDNRMWVY